MLSFSIPKITYRTLLVDWPAQIVDGAWLTYRVLLVALVLVAVTTLLLALVLLPFGIRFGW